MGELELAAISGKFKAVISGKFKAVNAQASAEKVLSQSVTELGGCGFHR